jgi:acetyl-CoA acetyltransferase
VTDLATSVASAAAIVGLGITDVGKVYGRSAADFAADACRRAVADAGLHMSDVDGLLVSAGISGGVDIGLQIDLGLRDLGLLCQMSSAGATAASQVQLAAMAIASGLATTVVCVHADAPLKPAESSGSAYSLGGAPRRGFSALATEAGRAPNTLYALAARRHMERYGTTSEHLGEVAVAQRSWAVNNPRAQFRDPISIDDHQHSPVIVDPLRRLDCCVVSNGGIALVVRAADKSFGLAKAPVWIWGWGQSHPGYPKNEVSEFGLRTGAHLSGARAYDMAGIGPRDIDFCELYDCYTYTVIVSLEDYGFCDKGDGGPFAASGALQPGGLLPTNTGGGQLSSYYLWGMTPLSEAVLQLRREGGERQVPMSDLALVSGNGGFLDFHSTLILSAHPR